MQSTLPEYLDVIQKAKYGTEIQGKWPISKLQRLSDLLLENAGDLHAELKFEQLGRIRSITGQVSAELAVTCQRCMQPMTLQLKSDFRLGLVINEAQADRLPEGYEPYLVEGDSENIPLMMEEELLLAMPLVAMHEQDCSAYLQQQRIRQQEEADRQEEQKVNPFASLKDLL